LFVELRGTTKLYEERLPFNVVFILNLFFAELAKAFMETNGHQANLIGTACFLSIAYQASQDKAC
jgi:adenylate cyclase